MDDLTNAMSSLTTTQAAHTNNNLNTKNERARRRRRRRRETQDLINRVHALPVELFDTIQDLVFTPQPNLTINVTETYKPPVQLQISQDTRKTFAAAYYAATTFNRSVRLYDKFLDSLSEEHRQTVEGPWMIYYSHDGFGEGMGDWRLNLVESTKGRKPKGKGKGKVRGRGKGGRQ